MAVIWYLAETGVSINEKVNASARHHPVTVEGLLMRN
jgi:hypothetical protein